MEQADGANTFEGEGSPTAIRQLEQRISVALAERDEVEALRLNEILCRVEENLIGVVLGNPLNSGGLGRWQFDRR